MEHIQVNKTQSKKTWDALYNKVFREDYNWTCTTQHVWQASRGTESEAPAAIRAPGEWN